MKKKSTTFFTYITCDEVVKKVVFLYAKFAINNFGFRRCFDKICFFHLV